MVAGVLDRPVLEHSGARGGHFKHLLEGEHLELAGIGYEPGVGAEHSLHVGVDLTDARVKRSRKRDCGCIRAAAAERGHVAAVRGHALEAGHEDDAVFGKRRADPVSPDIDDPRLRVRRVGDDSRL